MAGIPVWVIVLVVLAAVTGGYPYTVYVNTAGSIEEGRGVIGIAAVTFSGSFNEGPVTVGLSNGYTATVYWDGKAVGVIATTGKYIKIKGLKYYVDCSYGYGVKAQNNCPWYALLTSATLYDAKVLYYNGYFAKIDGPRYVEIEYSSELEASLKAMGIRFIVNVVGGKLTIKIPIVSTKYELYGKFAFYRGSSGFLGGCPTLEYHHAGIAYGTGEFMANA